MAPHQVGAGSIPRSYPGVRHSMSEKTPQKVPEFRVGVDIGGTFTDIVFLGSEGSIATKKVPSTPDDYSRAIMASLQEILQELNLSPTAVTGVVHATTVASNAILEGKGAKNGPAHHQRVSRRARDVPHSHPGTLQPLLRAACSSGAAEAQVRGRRAGRSPG